jgi:hypothetical protein
MTSRLIRWTSYTRSVTWLALLLAAGATVRLTLLVTRDQFPPTVWLRARALAAGIRWAQRQYRTDPTRPSTRVDQSICVDKARDWWLYKVLTCPWCVSFWIGLPAAATAEWAPGAWWFRVPALALSASLAAGLTGDRK